MYIIYRHVTDEQNQGELGQIEKVEHQCIAIVAEKENFQYKILNTLPRNRNQLQPHRHSCVSTRATSICYWRTHSWICIYLLLLWKTTAERCVLRIFFYALFYFANAASEYVYRICFVGYIDVNVNLSEYFSVTVTTPTFTSSVMLCFTSI